MNSSLILQRIGDLLNTEFKIPYERRLPYGSVAKGEYKLFLFIQNENHRVEGISRKEDSYTIGVVLATRVSSIESEVEEDYLDFMDKATEILNYFKSSLVTNHPYYLQLECESGANERYLTPNGVSINYSVDDEERSLHYATLIMTITNGSH